MKTIFKIATATVIAASLVSCNRSEDPAPNNPPSSGVLPKKMVSTYSNYPNNPRTVTYTYDGNKISEINIFPQEDVSKIKYTYTGDNITKIEKFTGSNFSSYYISNLEYQNDKLVKVSSPSGYNETTFVHNPDGTVIQTYKYSSTSSSQQSKLYFTGGNMVKRENLDANGAVVQTINYSYDTAKNGMLKNVTGLTKVLSGFSAYDEGDTGVNALTGITDTGVASNNSTYTYEYNSDSFPTKRVRNRNNVTATAVISY
ncbi:hypothetical protein MTP09_07485 [Chryseobacterium suipulveris]|uniref:DUF4595 domain-containing protein n=1 Tax=Chryseobacterium suipulveris TaxID=2929800 RepID=A0ABY4BKQ5_9FLAO|nr:hypothetical protein [Chryseobacterium suipulveris]UOE39768.1 hypothetical protein MTP09_07485 [Chryseobacterium suipulveris]